MSERFWKNLSITLGWLSIGVLFALITFSSSLEIKDLDLWLHLRMGWWICHHGFVPNYDVLSCAISGKPGSIMSGCSKSWFTRCKKPMGSTGLSPCSPWWWH